MWMAIARRTSALIRGRASIVLGLGLTMLALALCAAPAGAVIGDVAGHVYGLTPIRGVNPASLSSVRRAARSPAAATSPLPYDKAGQLTYHGGPVMHSVTTHVIYWDQSAEFTGATKSIVSKFFADVEHDSGLGTNVFGVAGQYSDGSGHSLYSSTFESEGTDSTSYPTGGCTVGPPFAHCVTDEQLRTELSAYITAHSLPRGPTQQYFVLFPHSVVTCLTGTSECSNNVFCAYHSSIEGGTAHEIIYSDIPFSLLDAEHAKECQFDGNPEVQNPNGDTAGYADVALKYTSHEYIEAATDPTGLGWWEFENGQEIGDKCNFAGFGSEPGEDPNAFLPKLGGSAGGGTLFNQSIDEGHFYLQSEWDNAANACGMRPVPVSGTGFTFSPSRKAGEAVNFEGAATDTYAGLKLTWKFGDGTEGAGFKPSHVYASGGTYEVTLTAKDELTGATGEAVTHAVLVTDQPTASFTVSPNPAIAGSPVSFNGSASSDPDGSIASYTWSFGDGTPIGAGATPTHIFAATGNYTVTLTITDSGGISNAVSEVVSVAKAQPIATLASNSSFAFGESVFNQRTGELSFAETVSNPGTLSWLATFQNGKFGVFTASNHKCKAGFVRLGGRCRPSKIVFARGSQLVAGPGAVTTLKLKPSRSALKALRNALRQKRGLPVTITLTFQSARGGSPVSHTRVVTVRLKSK
jgi:PKD repeat protein